MPLLRSVWSSWATSLVWGSAVRWEGLQSFWVLNLSSVWGFGGVVGLLVGSVGGGGGDGGGGFRCLINVDFHGSHRF